MAGSTILLLLRRRTVPTLRPQPDPDQSQWEIESGPDPDLAEWGAEEAGAASAPDPDLAEWSIE